MLATGEDELTSCSEMAIRKVFVVSAGFWDRVWRDTAQNAVTAAENRPVYNVFQYTVSNRKDRHTRMSGEYSVHHSIP